MSVAVTVAFEARPAFQTHLAIGHLRRFNERSTPWVADKRVAPYHRLDPRP